MEEPLLRVDDLRVTFGSVDTGIRAVDGVSFDVYKGETLGIVGESGSGKTVTVMALLGLIPSPPGNIAGGTAYFDGDDLLAMSRNKLRKIRGGEIGMIFQDAMTALNPVFTVGSQIAEALRAHNPDESRTSATEKAIGLLSDVGVPSPRQRFKEYPHQYSGGMRQRAMIAMAMANRPRLLIADEPTTALDVTIQAQVLNVLARAKADAQASTILITHDLGVIAEMADRVAVMYAGRFVETGTVEEVFFDPQHPYTIGLLTSLPRLDSEAETLIPIRGNPPSAANYPSGCRFHDRCDLSDGRETCATEMPDLIPVGRSRLSRCH
ncbi:MAG: ABC transporter ATP-binding protein, partial [Acidimicrobiia bacterium]|nr:ABC transporter ATP-binding protein [Acidimicrobiia bacterium]